MYRTPSQWPDRPSLDANAVGPELAAGLAARTRRPPSFGKDEGLACSEWREPDLNRRPLGYEPSELPTAPPRTLTLHDHDRCAPIPAATPRPGHRNPADPRAQPNAPTLLGWPGSKARSSRSATQSDPDDGQERPGPFAVNARRRHESRALHKRVFQCRRSGTRTYRRWNRRPRRISPWCRRDHELGRFLRRGVRERGRPVPPAIVIVHVVCSVRQVRVCRRIDALRPSRVYPLPPRGRALRVRRLRYGWQGVDVGGLAFNRGVDIGERIAELAAEVKRLNDLYYGTGGQPAARRRLRRAQGRAGGAGRRASRSWSRPTARSARSTRRRS